MLDKNIIGKIVKATGVKENEVILLLNRFNQILFRIIGNPKYSQ